MKKILLLILVLYSIGAQAQTFPSRDSLIRFLDKYVRTSVVESYKNMRLNTALKGILNEIDSATTGLTGFDSTYIYALANSKVPLTRTLTINGTVFDLSANRAWTIPTADTTSLSDRIDLKVDKITGKGLSTEDYSTAEKSKLAGIATGATANQTDAFLLARSNHTGTQLSSTISDFDAAVAANTGFIQNQGAVVQDAEMAIAGPIRIGTNMTMDARVRMLMKDNTSPTNQSFAAFIIKGATDIDDLNMNSGVMVKHDDQYALTSGYAGSLQVYHEAKGLGGLILGDNNFVRADTMTVNNYAPTVDDIANGFVAIELGPIQPKSETFRANNSGEKIFGWNNIRDYEASQTGNIVTDPINSFFPSDVGKWFVWSNQGIGGRARFADRIIGYTDANHITVERSRTIALQGGRVADAWAYIDTIGNIRGRIGFFDSLRVGDEITGYYRFVPTAGSLKLLRVGTSVTDTLFDITGTSRFATGRDIEVHGSHYSRILLTNSTTNLFDILSDANQTKLSSLTSAPLLTYVDGINITKTTSTKVQSFKPLMAGITDDTPLGWGDFRNGDKNISVYIDNTRGTGTNFGILVDAAGSASENRAGYFTATAATVNKAIMIPASSGSGVNDFAIDAQTLGKAQFAGNVITFSTFKAINSPASASALDSALTVDRTTGNLEMRKVPASNVGTVTNFSAGDLSPLFTTSEATTTSTPALTFSLSNAAAHTFFGNSTGSTGAPSFTAITAGDIPTLNQNTTGSAATLTTSRNIQGVAFNGSAAIDIINGTGFVKATGTTLSYDNSTYLTTASAASTYQPLDADLTTWAGVTPGTGIAAALAVNTGSAGAPVLFNGAGGTPSSLTLTNATGLPLGSITGLGSGIATWWATPSSANLITAVTDETGTGTLVFSDAPTFTGAAVFSTLQTNATNTSANFAVVSGNSVATTTNANIIFGGASQIKSRVWEVGSANGALAVNDSYGGHIIGVESVTEAASGTHAWISSLVVKPTTITNGSAATTNSATVYISDAATGATNNYALYVASGAATFQGTVTAASNQLTAAGNFSTQNAASTANLFVYPATGNSVSTSTLLFGGASQVTSRMWETGNVSPIMAVSDSYGGHIIGTQGVTEAASGTHAWVAALVVRPVTVTNAAATTTNSATVYVDGASAGGTNNWSLYSASGTVNFTNTAEQLRVSNDASNYFTTTVSATGVVAYDAVGSGSAFTFSDALSAPTAAAGTNTTQVATTAYAMSAAPNSSYRTLMETSGSHTAAKVAGTYALGDGDPIAVSGTGTLYPVKTIYIASADYPTVNGLAPKLRIRAQLYTNDVAPTGNYTFGLYPITRPGTSGGTGVDIFTLGTVVVGSDGATFTTPAADGLLNANGSDFALPADGHYVIGVITTGTVATNSHVVMSAYLQVRNN